MTPATARSILVGYDHSDEAGAGLRRAAALAVTHRAQLTVVHVAVPPPTWVSVGLMAMPLLEDEVCCGEALVRDAVARLPRELAVRWHLISGPDACAGMGRARCVRRALLRALDAGGHDLLVVGTGLRPGRVARGLARRCPDRLLVAPYADPAHAPTAAPPSARPLSA
ncbi:MAG TPA: universal stress protein [Capillimicrobium sp.]